MPYYNICPDCGSTLDPGEKCDCTVPDDNIRNIIRILKENPDFAESFRQILTAKERTPTGSNQ